MTAHLALLLALGCSGSPPASSPETAAETATEPVAPAPTVDKVGVDGLAAALAAGTVPVLVDVRTPVEYANGHVGAALNIPVGDLGDRMGELAAYRDGPVYLICQSGGRSGRAADQLLAAGFAAPVNVLGGTGAWIEAGHPVE
jgi:rhodanese-related sulfurtransferase